MIISVQKVLPGSGRATRRWPMYFSIRRSLPALPEPDNTFWTASTFNAAKFFLGPLDYCSRQRIHFMGIA